MLYERIIALCKERGVAVARLERECGLGNATIRGWEVSSPTVERLKRVADYFGVSLDFFFTDDSIAKTKSHKTD